MLGRRRNLKQYILYLNVLMDARLIDHLAPFVEQKRGNEELRRLIYAGLDQKPQSTKRQEDTREERVATIESNPYPSRPISEGVVADVKKKAKSFFG